MPPHSSGSKKGQQLIMPMARSEESPDILNGRILKALDLRSDWDNILKTVFATKKIQRTMEKSYQDFQEGFKLKDFKHRNGIKGAWIFNDINQGIYPYTLTTTNWVLEYEEKEWWQQASDDECKANVAINDAIKICTNLNGSLEILRDLESARNKLAIKYLPRQNNPESWRPQNASHWSSQWMRILAEIHYHELSNDWRLIASNTYSIVAGFSEDNIAYLIDIILLTTNPDEIVRKLCQE